MRRVIAVTVQLMKEMLTDADNDVRKPRTFGRDKDDACDECDCDCYECRAKQSAAAKVPA